MGWNESLAYFCMAMDTACDVAQAWTNQGMELPIHPMEPATQPSSALQCQTTVNKKYQMSAVNVDNFLQAAVEDRDGKLLECTGQATLHAIHNIVPAPTADNTPGTKDPISEKKLKKGDAQWDTIKEILGYELNDIDRMIQLPKEKAQSL
jgi:hypothetical protein